MGKKEGQYDKLTVKLTLRQCRANKTVSNVQIVDIISALFIAYALVIHYLFTRQLNVHLQEVLGPYYDFLNVHL